VRAAPFGTETLGGAGEQSSGTINFLSTNLAASRLRTELDRIPLWRGDNVATRQVIIGVPENAVRIVRRTAAP
jgi:hypothetical protein